MKYVLIPAYWIIVFALSVVVTWRSLPCSTIQAAEIFIRENHGIIISLGTVFLLSLLAYATAAISSASAEKAQKANRSLSSELKLSDFRQSWIDALRDDLSLASKLAARFEEDFKDSVIKAELVEVIARVRMRMNPNDPDDDALAAAFAKALGASKVAYGWDDETEAISIVGQRILKREWERLKADLKRIEERSP